MYQEQVLSYKHLDEPLDEGRFVFECILAREPLLHVYLSSFMLNTLWTVLCIGLAFSCYKINCSILVTLTERLHSW